MIYLSFYGGGSGSSSRTPGSVLVWLGLVAGDQDLAKRFVFRGELRSWTRGFIALEVET